MRFWMMLLLALTLGSVGAFFHLHQLIILDGINCTYAAFTLSGLFVLFVSAVWFHSSGNHDFDIIVASESIVAFGIASLTGGIVVGLSQALEVDVFANMDKEQIGKLATPFLEGIAIAAIAPIFAAILRNMGAAATAGSAAGGLGSAISGMTEDFKKMAELVAALTKQVSDLKDATRTSSHSMGDFGAKIKEYTEQLKTALFEAQSKIKGMGEAAEVTRASIHSLGTVLAGIKAPMDDIKHLSTSLSSIKERSEQLKDALGEAQTQVKEMATASNATGTSIRNLGTSISQIKTSSDAIKDLGTSLGKLNYETAQTANELKGLQKIIARFEGFIGHDRRAA